MQTYDWSLRMCLNLGKNFRLCLQVDISSLRFKCCHVQFKQDIEFLGITFKTLYNSLFLPYINYFNLIWASTYASYLEPLYLLQKKAIRIITFTPPRTPLFSNLNILSLHSLYKVHVFCFVFSHFKVIPLFCTAHTLLRITLRHPRWRGLFLLARKEQNKGRFCRAKAFIRNNNAADRLKASWFAIEKQENIRNVCDPEVCSGFSLRGR